MHNAKAVMRKRCRFFYKKAQFARLPKIAKVAKLAILDILAKLAMIATLANAFRNKDCIFLSKGSRKRQGKALAANSFGDRVSS